MHNADAPKQTSQLMSAGKVRSFRLLAAEDTARLAQFYLQLDAEQRRVRFGDTISDGALRKHCREIDWQRSLVVACMNASVVEATLEVHALTLDWRRAEVALACPLQRDGVLVISHLLQLAAFVAGRFGCEEFVAGLNAIGPDTLPLLNGMGEVRFHSSHAVVSLGDYAALSAGPPVPRMRRAHKRLDADTLCQ